MKKALGVLVLILLSAWSFAQAPTIPAGGITFSEVLCNRVTISWTNGNGAGRIVLAREEQQVDTFPTSGYIIGNAQFGTGDQLKIGQFAVYNGGGNSVVVTGLKQNTTYYFQVFEHNGSGSTFNYLVTGAPWDSVTTAWLTADFTIDKPHQCHNNNNFKYTPNVSQSLNQKVSYSWNFGDNKTDTAKTPNHTYTNYGKYGVKLTATTLGCVSIITKFDTVAPLPLVDFTLPIDTPNNEYVQCFFHPDGSKNRFYFKNTTINPPIIGLSTDEAFIHWDFGDGTFSTQYQGRKSYANPGTYRVVLTVSTTKTNARNIFCIDSVVDTVVVKPRPLNPDSIYFSDTVMCEKGNLFTFENKEPVPADSIIWYFGYSGIYNNQGLNKVSHSYPILNATKKYLVKLVFIDTAGCYDEYSDSIRVIRQPNNFFEGLDSPYCQYDPIVTLTPNIPDGVFFGDYVSPQGKFNPNVVGIHTISYRVMQEMCVDTFTKMTEVLPRPLFDLGNDTSICIGSSYDLSVLIGSSTAKWSDNSTDSFISVSDEGLYWLELDNGLCAFRDSIDVTVISPPSITLGRDSTLCGDGYRSVDITTDNGVYVWNDGYTEPVRIIDKTGFYQVLVYNKCGRDSAEVDLLILPYPCDVYVPSAFSPNGDHLNNVFRAIGNVEITSMAIYNRWGERIYYEQSPDPQWDGYYLGARVQQGTYFYIISYLLPDGEYSIPTTLAGPVTVVY